MTRAYVKPPRCHRTGCWHAPSRHTDGCSCGCPAYLTRLEHWWRVLIVTAWAGADQAWLTARDEIAIGYAEEQREFALIRPRPTLKKTMTALAGRNNMPEQEVA